MLNKVVLSGLEPEDGRQRTEGGRQIADSACGGQVQTGGRGTSGFPSLRE
ncbi:MAG: hypothetical protein MUO27_04830 [Sedimentisphaerales bacterium]|nr:hypothetical protein [Sedimentisphaerales bacterium]